VGLWSGKAYVGRAYDWVAINVCGDLLLCKGASVQVVRGAFVR